MNILAIIPAKLDSKRLPKKNISVILGKTLIEHAIDYAKKSKYNPTILLSSEADEVEQIAKKNGVLFSVRPKHLLGEAEVVDVYIDICNTLPENKYDYVVCLQPDNPNRQHSFDACLEYMIENNYDDLVTISPTLKRSGSVRIFKFKYLKQALVSKRIGTLADNAIDIHTSIDLDHATKTMITNG